jgi:hypothetical protein
MLGLGAEGSVWDNGLVLRVQHVLPPVDMARRIRSVLDEFDAWAIHDGIGDFIEHPSGGPLSRFLKPSPGAPFSQIFVLYRDTDPNCEQTVDRVRSQMKALCLPVFHFRDGQIMMLRSKESGRVTSQRCARQLPRFEGWAIVDSSGASYTTVGETEDIWEPTRPNELYFGDEAA